MCGCSSLPSLVLSSLHSNYVRLLHLLSYDGIMKESGILYLLPGTIFHFIKSIWNENLYSLIQLSMTFVPQAPSMIIIGSGNDYAPHTRQVIISNNGNTVLRLSRHVLMMWSGRKLSSVHSIKCYKIFVTWLKHPQARYMQISRIHTAWRTVRRPSHSTYFLVWWICTDPFVLLDQWRGAP